LWQSCIKGKEPSPHANVSQLFLLASSWEPKGGCRLSLKRAAEEYFSPGQFESIKAWARWTQEREFPDNYVAVAVEGDGEAFDFGYDYTECAIIKILRKMGYPELAPYTCFHEYPLSRLDGRGLSRTKTLACGDDVCDFRFKKGRSCTQSWDSEIGVVRERIKRQSNGCNR
jgi:hypothetical protein